jgi:hypothetical protein
MLFSIGKRGKSGRLKKLKAKVITVQFPHTKKIPLESAIAIPANLTANWPLSSYRSIGGDGSDKW